MSETPSTHRHRRSQRLPDARRAIIACVAVFCSSGCDSNPAIPPIDAGPPVIDRLGPAAGAEHSCFVDGEGTLTCWGDGNAGQLGMPAFAESPVTVALDGVRRVTARGNTTCAVDRAGSGWCFGAIVPDGPPEGPGSPVPVAVPGAPVTALEPGAAHACTLGVDQVVRCWGDNQRGQLGIGAMPDALGHSPAPLPVVELPPAVSLSVGDNHACAVLEDATVWCWGADFAGQLARDVAEPYFDPSPAAAEIADVAQIAAGDRGTCAVLRNGELWCWGIVGGEHFGVTPTRVSDMDDVSAVSLGGAHACALRQGAVWCWGENDDLQLGRSGEGGPDLQRVEWLEPAISIAAGGMHTCAELENGSAACWGSNSQGQVIVPGDPNLQVDVELGWDDDGLDVVIDGPMVNWRLGMAETGAGEQGWYGENCGLDSDFAVDVCHSMGPNGGRIESVYPDPRRVEDGFTLFDASFDPALTYILIAEEPIRSVLRCIAWGHSPRYYEDLGCVIR